MKLKTDFTDYKFRCHAVGKLMTGITIGGITEKQEELIERLEEKLINGVQLTDKQQENLTTWQLKKEEGTITATQQKNLDALIVRKNGRALTDKEFSTLAELRAKRDAKPKLSETAKTYLKELHKEELFGRKKDIQSKYLDKGLAVEEASISLYSRVMGSFYRKNSKRYENEFLTGEMDVLKDRVIDIKSSWEFSTFPLHDKVLKNKLYEWQLRAYMALAELNESEIAYCLVDTPDELIDDEIRRQSWRAGFIEVPQDFQDEIRRNMTFSDIPEKLRVKRFEVLSDEIKINYLYKVIEIAREYLNELSFAMADELEVVNFKQVA